MFLYDSFFILHCLVRERNKKDFSQQLVLYFATVRRRGYGTCLLVHIIVTFFKQSNPNINPLSSLSKEQLFATRLYEMSKKTLITRIGVKDSKQINRLSLGSSTQRKFHSQSSTHSQPGGKSLMKNNMIIKHFWQK